MTLSYWFVDPWLLSMLGLIAGCFLVVFVLVALVDVFDYFDVWGGVVGFIKEFCLWAEDILIMWVMIGFYLVAVFGIGAIASQCIINPIMALVK